MLVAGFFLADTAHVQAATFTVACTGNADNDGVALQTAVATANSNSQADTINLAANCIYQLPTALHFGADGGRLLTVNGNGATIRGGRGAERHVLTVDNQAAATVDRATFSGGIASGSFGAAGGLIVYGNITLNRSTIRDNIGSQNSALAIFVFYTNVAPFPTITLNNSTVSNNRASGIASGSNGIRSGGVLIFNNSTYAYNDLGIFITEGKFTANNSILSNCSTLTTPLGVYAISHSLVESGNCPVSNGVNGNIVGQSAGLLPLTGNPAYHPLPPGSPALNVGDNTLVPAGVTTDQAGNPRLFGTVDMGSVEYQSQPRTVTVSTNRVSIAEGEAATLTFVRTAPLNDALDVVFTVTAPGSGADSELRDANGQLVTNRVTIPAGASSTTVTLTAVDDWLAEADETAVVTLVDKVAYNPGSPNAATVTIAANDYLVTKLTDYSGAAAPDVQEGTLRRAIENANHSATADTITFQGVNGTITLVGGTLTIANQGALTIEAAGITLNGNNAVMPVLINTGATAVLNDITITGGKGSNAGEAGALMNFGTVTLNDALITGNRTDTGISDGYGGGLSNNGTMTLNRSVVSNNFTKTGGGGISNGGTLNLNSSSVIGNESTGHGGGISGGFVGSITLVNSTVSGNRVTATTDPIAGGGGIFNGSQMTLINSTVSNNTSIMSAGGILNQGAMILRNTILANSTGSDCVNSGTRAATNTLVEDGSCNIAAGVNGNKTGDPMLAALTGNPAFHPLTAGSPAIDAGNNSSVPAGLTLDQSGNQRFFPINGTVDMGAFEFGQMMVALTVDTTNVNEGGTALITISRVGSLSNPLTVRFARSGSASSADYALQQDNAPLTVDEVVIPAGAASVQIAFQTVDDVSAEADETGVISLVDTDDYNLGAVTVATITIPANDLVVTNLNDFTNATPADARGGTLRQALRNADSFAGADTVAFTVAGVIQLSGGSLTTNGSALTTIEGAGITVDGGGNGSVFQIGGPTTINDLTITGGNADSGGGLRVGSLLTLNRSTVRGNSAQLGGGIYNLFGTVTINHSTISDNHATDYAGGIWNDEALDPNAVNMTINNSTISGNRASHIGGIGHWANKMVINNSAIVNNIENSNLGGDGLWIQSTLEVNNSILRNGQLSGGVLYGYDCYVNGGTVTFRNTLVRQPWQNCTVPNGANGNIVGQDPNLGVFTGNPAYYPLNPGSPAINAGDNALIPAGITTDQAGNPRLVGDSVDMGPIEFNSVVPPSATPTTTPEPPTETPVPATATPTNTTLPPTATSTETPVPPTATPTNTSVPPTATPTNTVVPPTPTNTPIPPTATPDGTVVGSCGTITVYRNAAGNLVAPGWVGTIKVGTNGANTINGGSGPDLMLGLGGNDTLDGKGGDDLLCGGDGVDLLTSAAGNDYLDGGAGNDVLNGGAGDYDTLVAGDGNDTLLDWDGVLSAQGGPGNDTFTLALRIGWRNQSGQPSFNGLTAGYGDDTVGLALLDPAGLLLDISGDERDNPASPLEGQNDLLALVGGIDPASQMIKFEQQLVLTASVDSSFIEQGFAIDPTTLTDESGVEFLSEPAGGDEPVEESEGVAVVQNNFLFLPLVNR
ncbi:MAG: hypothetical protein DYG89_27995 [Caldilinea sp. CFX5]|nr:hypothetical protein [Caldilinea sp. CFX5]